MSIETKKHEMAEKMYKMHGTGGVGGNIKTYMHGKETKKGGHDESYKMHGKTTGYNKGQHFYGANRKGSFEDKYEMADKSGTIKGGYHMNAGHSEGEDGKKGIRSEHYKSHHETKRKSGKESLLRKKGEKNEGEHLTLGKRGNEEPVA